MIRGKVGLQVICAQPLFFSIFQLHPCPGHVFVVSWTVLKLAFSSATRFASLSTSCTRCLSTNSAAISASALSFCCMVSNSSQVSASCHGPRCRKQDRNLQALHRTMG